MKKQFSEESWIGIDRPDFVEDNEPLPAELPPQDESTSPSAVVTVEEPQRNRRAGEGYILGGGYVKGSREKKKRVVSNPRQLFYQRKLDNRARIYVGGTIKDLAEAFGVRPVTVHSWFQRGLLIPGVAGETAAAIVSVARLLVKKGIVGLEDILPPEDFEVVRKALGLRR